MDEWIKTLINNKKKKNSLKIFFQRRIKRKKKIINNEYAWSGFWVEGTTLCEYHKSRILNLKDNVLNLFEPRRYNTISSGIVLILSSPYATTIKFLKLWCVL